MREVTNRTGFCKFHFDKMLRVRNRLSLALILESHLDFLNHSLLEGKEGALFQGEKGGKGEGDCRKLLCLRHDPVGNGQDD